MVKLYKLTDHNHETRGHTKWGPGVTHSGTGEGELCGPGFIHAYEHPLLAALLNPIHSNFAKPVLWEAEGEIAKRDGQLKCGCVSLTVTAAIPLPVLSVNVRVRFAIHCALTVYKAPAFVKWAKDWLSGKDRSARSARSAEAAAAWSAEAAWSAARSAARSAEAAAAWSAEAAWSAARSARSAEAAARSAEINFVAIAEQAVREDANEAT